jgi:hypothetical protein
MNWVTPLRRKLSGFRNEPYSLDEGEKGMVASHPGGRATMRQSANVISVSLVIVASVILSDAQVNVTTYHNDNARTGQNIQEVNITPANIGTFEELFAVPVDGQVYAQPLVLSNVSIGGGTHNVVYVATEHDSVYAIDAANGNVYWRRSLIPSGATTQPSGPGGINCPNNDINGPEYGITSTPVIDPSTGTLYVVPGTVESGAYIYRLHAIDVSTGLDKATINSGMPVEISATLNGDNFVARQQMNRPGLLLENGHVIIAWGSHCDLATYFGWVMSYNASTLAQEAVYNDDPNGGGDNGGLGGGIWMSGGGVASDSSGNLYFATGNGDFEYVSSPVDFGCSILKLPPVPPAGTAWIVADWYTPYNEYNECHGNSDNDLGSGGVLLLPTQPAGDMYTELLVQMGKTGALSLVNRNDLGGYCNNCTSQTGDTNIVQEILNATVGVWGSPAYWNGNVYFGGADTDGDTDPVKAFSLYGTKPQLELTSTTPQKFGYPTPTPSVSSNGNSNGILWVLDDGRWKSSCCAVLHAYDATNLATELYSSATRALRDEVGGAVKFTVPTVANGRVFVGASQQLVVYGLLSSVTVQRPTTDAVTGVPCYPSVGPTIPSPTSIPYAYDAAGDSTSSVIDTTSGNVLTHLLTPRRLQIPHRAEKKSFWLSSQWPRQARQFRRA